MIWWQIVNIEFFLWCNTHIDKRILEVNYEDTTQNCLKVEIKIKNVCLIVL